VPPRADRRSDLSYLGTFAEDRQAVLERFFIAPARLRPERRFVLAGSQYPADFPWTPNMHYVWHMPPSDHAALFSSSLWTLNITRSAMAEMGYCPSGRLFEATACGAPVLSDAWDGLHEFFALGRELLVVRDTSDVLAALELSDRERRAIARAGRDRTLACHTATIRARELSLLLEPGYWAARGTA
jgi:spore maturation protein CgeB